MIRVSHCFAVAGDAGLTPASREPDVLWAQLDATDRQIDRLVYELYGLTAAEV